MNRRFHVIDEVIYVKEIAASFGGYEIFSEFYSKVQSVAKGVESGKYTILETVFDDDYGSPVMYLSGYRKANSSEIQQYEKQERDSALAQEEQERKEFKRLQEKFKDTK